jgi:predicted dehydrogenase
MTYRCAIVGAGGPRAAEHAEAYTGLHRGELVAATGRNASGLDAFARRFGVPTYADHRELLEASAVDVLHIVTPPDIRLEILKDAAAAGVRAVVLEKPIAISGTDLAALREFERCGDVLVAVNHQLHFHKPMRHIRKAVLSGALGRIELIDASARHNLAYQGTHLIQAVHALTGSRGFATVFAQVGGPRGLIPQRGHVAPDLCLAAFAAADGTRCMLQCGDLAPVDDRRIPERHRHQRITVYGDAGWARWSMNQWTLANLDGHASGPVDYYRDDADAQIRFTDAVFDWLDDVAEHPCSLRTAITEFDVILASYASAVARTIHELPTDGDPLDALIEVLRP